MDEHKKNTAFIEQMSFVNYDGNGLPKEGIKRRLLNSGWTLRIPDEFYKYRKKKAIKGTLSGDPIRNEEDFILEIPAKIPGNVRDDLISKGLIKPLLFYKNNLNQDIISDFDWTYHFHLNIENEVKEINEKLNGTGIIHIIFDGLDYNCDIFFNGRKVKKHEGMFSQEGLLIIINKGIKLNPPKQNKKYANLINLEEIKDITDIELKVHFRKQPKWRTHALKCQMAYGWDFAPRIRTVGIWRDVKLITTGQAFISIINMYAEPLIEENDLESLRGLKNNTAGVISKDFKVNLKIKGNINYIGPNLFKIKLILKDHSSGRVFLEEEFGSNELNAQNLMEENENKGINLSVLKFNADLTDIIKKKRGTELKLPLWYPHKFRPLKQNAEDSGVIDYKLELYTDGKKEKLDEYNGRVLNRKISWARNPGTFREGENWTLEINGIRMFLRGINWAPIDSLFGTIRNEKYDALIKMAVNANIDILRVWGGGILEKEAFYNLCDEAGLMIWQEFPFACTNYPKKPRYIKLAEKECNAIANRSSGHPSLVVYCGGNEFNPYINAHIINIVKNAVENFAPDRYCFKASPFQGDDHNWRFWGMRRMLDAYEINRTNTFQMLTEFGIQALPDMETLKFCLPEDYKEYPLEKLRELSPTDEKIKDALTFHKADINGLIFYAERFGFNLKDVTLERFIEITQNIQAYALKYAIENCRAAWPNVSGVFPWQLSDPWPNISWSIVDYNLKPKFAYNMVKLAFSEILPMIKNWKYLKSNRGHNSSDGRGDKNEKRMSGDVIIHNNSIMDFSGRLEIVLEIIPAEVYMKLKTRKFIPLDYLIEHNGAYTKEILNKSLRVKAKSSIKVARIEFSFMQREVPIIRLRLYSDNKKNTENADGGGGNMLIENIAEPLIEPVQNLRTKLTVLKDMIDARFDGWWRKYMIKLMELERIREDHQEWRRMTEEYKKGEI
ncbi:MAG: glycosyl hydrolase 2 galactose-binding domain-containing protein [Promethearchaeota archaeon]